MPRRPEHQHQQLRRQRFDEDRRQQRHDGGGVLKDIGESVVLKVSGKNPSGVSSGLADPTDMANPFDLGDWVVDSDFPFNAANLQIVYGGTASMGMGGNSNAAAVIYAPERGFQPAGQFGSLRLGPRQDDHQWRQPGDLLRPPAAERLLRPRQPDGQQLHLEPLLTSSPGIRALLIGAAQNPGWCGASPFNPE